MKTAEAVIKKLGLSPHPEGGYYLETYRSRDLLKKSALPSRYDGDRCASTAIYYLLEKDNFSALHQVQSDEIFHFYLGGPVEIFVISPDGRAETAVIGNDIESGQLPQYTVLKGSIQGLRVAPGFDFALLGSTVAPGFDFADFKLIPRAAVIDDHPEFSELIKSLTRT